jgi:hypothetical protein
MRGSGSADRSRGELLVGVAAAKFGGGGYREVALLAGGVVPVGPVGHHGGEDGFALAVGVVQSLVAAGQHLLLFGVFVAAATAGGAGFGGGAAAGQVGVPGAGADLAELITDPLGGLGCFDRVGIAQMQQPPVRHTAHIRAVNRARAAKASCQTARRSGATATGSGPIGSVGLCARRRACPCALPPYVAAAFADYAAVHRPDRTPCRPPWPAYVLDFAGLLAGFTHMTRRVWRRRCVLAMKNVLPPQRTQCDGYLEEQCYSSKSTTPLP